MMFTGWMGFVLLGVAAVFGYHLWVGLRTRIVRFPMSILSLQAFEHDQGSANYWGIMAANLMGLLFAFVGACYVLSSALPVSTKPITALRVLDGCYEGEGLPDIMRPPVHWTLRVNNGSIVNRAGQTVALLRLLGAQSGATPVRFSPGLIIGSDEHKSSTVYAGDMNANQAYLRGAMIGKAYISWGRATISLADDWGNVLLKTNCD